MAKKLLCSFAHRTFIALSLRLCLTISLDDDDDGDGRVFYVLGVGLDHFFLHVLEGTTKRTKHDGLIHADRPRNDG